MTFDNLLYYPGFTQSPLRLVHQPLSLFPTDDPASQSLDDAATHDNRICFYSLKTEIGSTRTWLVATTLTGGKKRGGSDNEGDIMEGAVKALQRDWQKSLYPGSIIVTSPKTFKTLIDYDTYVMFTDRPLCSSSLATTQSTLQSTWNRSLDTHDQDPDNLASDDPYPTCIGSITLRRTKGNLLKGGSAGRNKIGRDSVVGARSERKAQTGHTWKGEGWTVLDRDDPRYRPFKDLIEGRIQRLILRSTPEDSSTKVVPVE